MQNSRKIWRKIRKRFIAKFDLRNWDNGWKLSQLTEHLGQWQVDKKRKYKEWITKNISEMAEVSVDHHLDKLNR